MPRSEQAFVGRATELAALRQELDRLARPGATGRIVVVTADPGVGKTRLLAEFAARCRSARVLVGRGSPLGATIPLAIVAEPLAAHLDTMEGQGGLPELHDLVRPDAAGGLALFVRLRRVLTALAADRPLVLVLDDLHLADRASWDLIAYLGRVPPAAPVLVLAAARVAPLSDDAEFTRTVGALIRDRLAAELRLQPLTESQVGELVRSSVETPDPDLVEWIYRRGRGNPLLTVAMLRELGQAVTPGGPPRTVAGRAAVPASVAERVRQVQAVLPATARRALELAAVLGHPFPATTVAPLLGDGAADALELLVAERLLVENSDGYDFAHPLIQEAVYSGLSPARRREHHERVASVLVTAPLAVRAYHTARSALPGDLTAVALLREAAAEAAGVPAHREALRHATAALALIPVGSATALRERVLDDIAGHASLVPDHDAGIRALRELATLQAGEPVALARTKMRLASFLSTGAADVTAAERAATEAVELLRVAPADAPRRDAKASTVDLAAAVNERAWIRGMAGDFAGQAEGCREALALIGPGPDGAAEHAPGDAASIARLHAIGPLGGVLGLLGDFAEARECHARARMLASASGDTGQIGWQAAVASLTELYAGRFADAAAIVDPPVDAAPLLADIATPWRTLTDWFLGRWRVGQRDCAAVRELFPVAPSAHMAWSFAMAALFETATSAGGGPGLAPGARAWAGLAQRAYADRDLYFFAAVGRWALGTAHALSGEPDAALPLLQRSAAWFRRTGAVGFEGLLLAELPEVLVALGQLDEARAHAQRAQEVATELGTPFAAAQAAYVRALVASAHGRRSTAQDAYTEAVDGYAACGAPFAEARALERRAAVGSGTRALADLDAAARRYGALPAPAHRDRVLARMRGSGAVGRRAAQHVGELTAREREIALLAVRGLTTVEIAGRLHLSERTVESHLGRVYRKLGITGRAGLGRALASDGGE